MSPIDLRRPSLVDVDNFEGHDRRRLAGVQNRIMEKAFQQTESASALIMMTIRWSMLHRFRSDFAEDIGIGKATVATMENDRPEGSRIQRDVYTKVIQYLESQEIAHDVHEQLLQALVPGNSTLDFEERIGYEIGFRKMLELIGIGNKAWWQRGNMGVIVDLRELIDLVQKAYPGKRKEASALRDKRLEQGIGAWTRETVGRYRSRTLEEPLSKLLTDLERYCVRDSQLPFTEASICTLTGCTQETASDLMNARLISWDRACPIVQEVYGKIAPAVRSAWKIAEDADHRRDRFSRVFPSIRDTHGIENAELAACLGVCSPEERMNGYESDRTEGYRPSADVRRAIQMDSLFGQVQMRSLVELIAPTVVENVRLQRLFREERTRHYRRTGSVLEDDRLDLRIDREFNGVTLEALAAYLLGEGIDDGAIAQEVRRLQNIEIGHGSGGSVSGKDIAGLRGDIDRMGDDRVQGALLRQRERKGEVAPLACTQAKTVQEFAVALRDWQRSLRGVKRKVFDATNERTLLVSQPRMAKMIRGEVVPSLPILRNMSRVLLGQDLSKEVQADWYNRFPESFSFRGGCQKSPVDTVLATVIAANAVSPRKFAEERMDGNARWFWAGVRPNSRYATLRWEKVEAMLLGADISENDPTWWLTEKVVEQGKDFSEALRSTLRRMRHERVQISPSNLIGVTWGQLEKAGVMRPKESNATRER